MEYPTDMSNLESENYVRLIDRLNKNPELKKSLSLLGDNGGAVLCHVYTDMLRIHGMKRTWDTPPPGTTTSAGAADEEPPFRRRT